MPGERERHLQQHWPADPSVLGPGNAYTLVYFLPCLTSHASHILPYCPRGRGPGKPPGTRRMYLWASLFHEALFEVVPGDEGHELGEKETCTDPLTDSLGGGGSGPPLNLAVPQRGSLEWGRMCVLVAHGAIFGTWYGCNINISKEPDVRGASQHS